MLRDKSKKNETKSRDNFFNCDKLSFFCMYRPITKHFFSLLACLCVRCTLESASTGMTKVQSQIVTQIWLFWQLFHAAGHLCKLELEECEQDSAGQKGRSGVWRRGARSQWERAAAARLWREAETSRSSPPKFCAERTRRVGAFPHWVSLWIHITELGECDISALLLLVSLESP